MNQMTLNKVLPDSKNQLKGASIFILILVLISLLLALNTCEKPERVVKLTTLDVLPSDITYNSTILKGEIIDMGSAPVDNYGILLSENSNLVFDNSQIKSLGKPSSKGVFQVLAESLTANKTYFFRSFVTVNFENIYAEVKQFQTKNYDPATLSTTSISSVTSTSAYSGGNVTADGGAAVTARGVCWNTSTGPAIANSKTTDGSGTGSFISNITGLTANTKYYVRAYATNSSGPAYGNELSFTTNAPSPPSLSTTSISGITQNAAASGGNITDDGGATVIARGACWNTSPGPTTANNKTTDGSGTGSFGSSLTGLTVNTKYYVRAYATNSAGTAYGNEQSFTTIIITPTLTTIAISSITKTTASCGGNITDDGGASITARGVCWNTSSNPTILNSNTSDGSGSGTFSSSLTGLTADTKYYVRAYATNSAGTAYGNEQNFTTNAPSLPSISTTSVSGITQNAAVSGGNITDDGGATVTARGVCWSTTANPTITDLKTINGSGTGSFASNITGLSPVTTYHVRAYASNSAGTAYGVDVTFSTICLPSVTTTAISSITTTTAASGGNVTSDCGSTVTARGVCWSTTASPTISNPKTTDGSGTGLFTSSMTGLTQGTTYHVRAYATNSAGTAYGVDVTFTTTCFPTITTSAIPSYAATTTTASAGGNVTSDCGFPITARGVCWDIFNNPTIDDSKTIDGSGMGSFTSNITGLTPGTMYHVRAYATNAAGTAYGVDVAFTTLCFASVTTTAISSITATTATSGGNVTSDCGSTVVTRGVCWSISANPTTDNSRTYNDNGIGSFISYITGLTPGTTYHLRAYATNAAGTAYGADITFTTIGLPSITTAAITSYTNGSATGGGNITSDGGAPVTARGICWSTATGPTTSDYKTSDGTGNGSFVSSMTDLLGNTIYYVRAYAVNSVGKVYGNEITFTTLPPSIPTLTTTAITSITTTTATSGGNITSGGGSPVTSRGVCWSTIANPTITDANTNSGTGSGLFISYLTGLNPGANYHVRSYATNSIGTAYGEDMTFTTIPPTVTDIDGNSYNAITIGGQIWMKENLKTTKLTDGTAITQAYDNTAWNNISSTAPGYCYYNYDAVTYKNVYGPLYNYYTINTGKLCPNGWHVPTDADFTQLISYSGGSNAGSSLKEAGTAHWQSPNTGATNETGFTALPGGLYAGGFMYVGQYGNWWTSSVITYPRIYVMYFNSTSVGGANGNSNYGCSVRCLRDN